MSCLTVDIYNNLKQTPLHLAVITEQPYIAEKLVSAGANVNLPDRNGQTPTHLACNRSSIQCLETLLKAENPADLELRNFSGFTPLHEAVLARCPGAVTCLINHGANVNCKVSFINSFINNYFKINQLIFINTIVIICLVYRSLTYAQFPNVLSSTTPEPDCCM